MPTKKKQNNSYRNGLNKLIEWVKNKNWEVLFGTYGDEMDPFERIITINARFKTENQLYACLHECGHLLLNKNKNYIQKYPNTFLVESKPTKNKQLARSEKYQLDVISEEIDAWRKGKDIAKRLGIYINEKNYNNEMAKYVFTYIKSAVDK